MGACRNIVKTSTNKNWEVSDLFREGNVRGDNLGIAEEAFDRRFVVMVIVASAFSATLAKGNGHDVVFLET